MKLVGLLFDYRAKLLLVTLASLAIYALANNLYWWTKAKPASRLGRFLGGAEAGTFPLVLYHICRFCFYLGIPYLALLYGLVSPRLLGLAGIDWVRGLGAGTALGLGAFVLLVGGWRYYLGSIVSRPRQGHGPGEAPLQPWASTIVGVIYSEAHWAFYRGAPLSILGDYWGVFAGVGLVFLEWATVPALRQAWGTAKGVGLLWAGSVALAMAIIFLFTRNLWLCVAIHVGLEVGLSHFLRGYLQVEVVG